MRSPLKTLSAIKQQLAILVLAPLLIVATLLLLLGLGLHQLPLVISNEDRGFDMPMAGHINMPETLIKALDPRALKVTLAGSPAEAQALFEAGKAKVYLQFPAELTQDMLIKVDDPTYVLPHKIEIRVEGDNPLFRLLVAATIAKTSIAAIAESGGGISPDSLPIPIDLGPLLEGLAPAPAYMATAVLGFLAWVLTGLLSLFDLLSLRRAKAEPPEGPGAALTFALAFGLGGWLLYLGLAGLAALITGLVLPARFVAGSAVLLLLCLAAASISLAAGTRAKSVDHLRPLIPYFILPLFFAGFLFPLELLPTWLRWLPWLFPPFYGLNATLAVELGRSGSATVWSIAATGLIALVFLALASLPHRNKIA